MSCWALWNGQKCDLVTAFYLLLELVCTRCSIGPGRACLDQHHLHGECWPAAGSHPGHTWCRVLALRHKDKCFTGLADFLQMHQSGCQTARQSPAPLTPCSSRCQENSDAQR